MSGSRSITGYVAFEAKASYHSRLLGGNRFVGGYRTGMIGPELEAILNKSL